MEDKTIWTPEFIIDTFFYRSDVFALQTNKGYFPVKRPITVRDIEKHLAGEITIGAYCMGTDNKVKWCCVDIDGQEDADSLAIMRFQGEKIYNLFPEFGRILEFSGRRGYHIWVLFKEPISAELATRIVKARLSSRNIFGHEIYPKQTELNEFRKYGNLVKVPFALHKVSGKRSEIIKYEAVK